MRLSVLIVIVLTCSSWAFAQDGDTIDPDRPSFSNNTHIVPAGHVQLEGGAGRIRYGSSSGYSVGELLVRFGVSNRVEVRAQIPSYLVVRNSGGRKSGTSDAVLESKFRFRSGDRASFGVLSSATLPTGSPKVAEHMFQPGVILISDVRVSKVAVITSNVGYTRAAKNGTRYNYTFAASRISVALQSNLSVFTEFYLYHQQIGSPQKYADSGVASRIGKHTEIDIHGGVGLPHNNAHGPDHYIGIGISHLF